MASVNWGPLLMGKEIFITLLGHWPIRGVNGPDVILEFPFEDGEMERPV